MMRTYWWDAPAGRLSIRQYKLGPWRLWAGDKFLGSFETPEDALHGLAAAKLGARWKAPGDIERWQVVAGRLPPNG